MSTHNNLPFTVGVGWQGLQQKTLMGITKNQLDIQTTNKAQNIEMVDKRQNFLWLINANTKFFPLTKSTNAN